VTPTTTTSVLGVSIFERLPEIVTQKRFCGRIEGDTDTLVAC
jgi:hypothetical protein